jgi:hypothetical protein
MVEEDGLQVAVKSSLIVAVLESNVPAFISKEVLELVKPGRYTYTSSEGARIEENVN